MSRSLLALLFLVVLAVPARAERDRTPPPVRELEPSATLAGDLELPTGGPGRIDDETLQQLHRNGERGKKVFLDTTGGDDVLVGEHPWIQGFDMDIAANGDIYLGLVASAEPSSNVDIHVYRSTDGGDTWTLWGSLADGTRHRQVDLEVVEGTNARCYLAYAWSEFGFQGTYEIRVSWNDLSASSASFSNTTTAMATAGLDYQFPSLAEDSIDFASYFLYLGADSISAGSDRDVRFSRSTNYAASWETPYVIGNGVAGSFEYRGIHIAYGSGGRVFAAWWVNSPTDAFNPAIRFRRVLSYASGGSGSWESIKSNISPELDAYRETSPVVWCRPDQPDEVMIAWSRTSSSLIVLDKGVALSVDGGANFQSAQEVLDTSDSTQQLTSDPSTGDWILLSGSDRAAITRRVAGTWGPTVSFADEARYGSIAYPSRVALDPTRGYQTAAASVVSNSDITDQLWFDAEWRNDEGYPNLEENFPVALPSTPISPPALVDLNDDGTLETVFSLGNGEIWAVQADGTSLPGWPVDAGTLSGSPVAIGDLNGDGKLSVVAGDAFGQVWAYDVEGQLLPGFPFAMPNTDPVYVSIGALGGPYARTIVAVSGRDARFINYRGVAPLDTFGWVFFDDAFEHPAAIGDVDGDGVAEAVFGIGKVVVAVRLYDLTSVMSRTLDAAISGTLTLGDLDGDGDVEVCAPTEAGTLYVLDDDGSDFGPGWPWSSGSGTPLSSVALAQILGTFEPELVVADQYFTVHVLYDDAVEQSGFPVETGLGWFLFGMPIVDRIEGFSGDIVIGSRDSKIYSWNNFSTPNPGWPKNWSGQVNLTAASGDIDDDGRLEVVFLTSNELGVVDVATAPLADGSRRWPMEGYDPQRTGCANCSEDVVTAVDDGLRSTRVSFAAPSPNPTSSSTLFRYRLPAGAEVSLDVYDLRGRRVRGLVQTTRDAGEHSIVWDGRDDRGRGLASGNYFARLKVSGAGLDETRTRRITLVR